jgi:hypothetical protein
MLAVALTSPKRSRIPPSLVLSRTGPVILEQQEETDTGGDDLDKLSPSADDATVLRTSAWAVGGSQDSREFQCSPRLGLLACAPYGCTPSSLPL